MNAHVNAQRSFDVFTLGESMLRLSVPIGRRLLASPSFDVHVGGSESNVAIALGRLGRSVSWASRVPDNELARRVVEFVASAGVDTSGVRWDSNARLGTYFVELRDAPSSPSVLYDRAGSAASLLSPDDLDLELLASAHVVHLTGITPALSASCADLISEIAASVAAHPDQLLSVDVNYRAKLWSPADASVVLRPLISAASVVLCAESDARTVFEVDGPPDEMTAQLQELSGGAAIVMSGGATGVHWRELDNTGLVTAPAARVVDRIGAGDALAAGVLDGILDNDFHAGVVRGVAMAAITVATEGDTFPGTRSEVDAIGRAPGRVDR